MHGKVWKNTLNRNTSSSPKPNAKSWEIDRIYFLADLEKKFGYPFFWAKIMILPISQLDKV